MCQYIKHEFAFIQLSIFSIDLSTVTSKGPENHRSTKQGSIPPLYLKDSLGPGWYHSQPNLTGQSGFITWWFEPEQNRGDTKYQIAAGIETFWPCPYLKSVSSSVSFSLSFCLSISVYVCHGFQLQEGHCRNHTVNSFSLICEHISHVPTSSQQIL